MPRINGLTLKEKARKAYDEMDPILAHEIAEHLFMRLGLTYKQAQSHACRSYGLNKDEFEELMSIAD